MTHKTKGIVLKTIKYGETSLVVSIYTELFGIQTYMVNGVRSAKKTGSKAAMYQTAAILDLEVYNNGQQAMQRIKESTWAFLYQHILSDVVKNSIALFMVELVHKTLKQPEKNAALFYFCEDAFTTLDAAPATIAANFPLYFALNLTDFLGFKMSANQLPPDTLLYLDLIEGIFTGNEPPHPHFISGDNAIATAYLLQIMQPHELDQVKLNSFKRKELLLKYQDYYALHLPDFGTMKTLPILHEVLG